MVRRLPARTVQDGADSGGAGLPPPEDSAPKAQGGGAVGCPSPILSLLSSVATGTPHHLAPPHHAGGCTHCGRRGHRQPRSRGQPGGTARQSLEPPLRWGPGKGSWPRTCCSGPSAHSLSPTKDKKSGPRRDGPNCTVRRLMVKVRDLGLGFDSDEIVPFKYCSGSCHRSRSNYDLTLATLLRGEGHQAGPAGPRGQPPLLPAPPATKPSPS
ncbi:unnamed protein product [Eretmochelys imbricata]